MIISVAGPFFAFYKSSFFVFFVHLKVLYPVSIYASFTMENWSRLFAAVSDLLHDVLTESALMGTLRTPSGETGGELLYPPPYSFEKYIRLQAPIIDVRSFATMLTREAFTMRAGYEKRQTAFAGWFQKWKHWYGRRNLTAETHAPFIDMPFL